LFTNINLKYTTYNLDIINEYQKLVLKFPPLIYSDETNTYIQKLAENNELVLSSNTLFITGETLKTILNDFGWPFSNMLFSDVIGVSKPNKKMYMNSSYHIGDNEITDGVGPDLIGTKYIIINSNNKTIKDAYNIISKK